MYIVDQFRIFRKCYFVTLRCVTSTVSDSAQCPLVRSLTCTVLVFIESNSVLC